MAVRFIGLDGEMTSSDLSAGGTLIQLGLSMRDEDGVLWGKSVGINPFLDKDDSEIHWTRVAESVHGFTKEDLKIYGSAEEADQILVDWLIARGRTTRKRGENIPVGFNVGVFDMPFVKAALPKTYEFFSRRTVDLNPLLFALDGVETDFNGWKDRAKQYAIKQMGFENQHDAGWDSAMHLHCFEFLSRTIQEGVSMHNKDRHNHTSGTGYARGPEKSEMPGVLPEPPVGAGAASAPASAERKIMSAKCACGEATLFVDGLSESEINSIEDFGNTRSHVGAEEYKKRVIKLLEDTEQGLLYHMPTQLTPLDLQTLAEIRVVNNLIQAVKDLPVNE